MMTFQFGIEYADGSGDETTASFPDFVAFERKYDRPGLQALTGVDGQPRIEWLLFMAWHSLKRAKPDLPEFDPWCETVVNMRRGEEHEPPPLESKASTGS
jgi:hypothetical protein